MSVLLNLGDKITAGNQADATLFYKKRVVADSGTLLTEPETDVNNRELLAQKLFDKASIVYTAGGVKAGTNYSVKGTDFDVVRAGVKNVVNRAGVLTEVASGVPATEFSDGVLKGTLIEPAATNLLLHSEAFDNAYWTKTNATITANNITAPDGTMTADTVADTSGGGVGGRVQRDVTAIVSTGTVYTLSSFQKRGTSNKNSIRYISSSATAFLDFNFDTEDVTISGDAYVSHNVVKLPSGWYRLELTFTTSADLSGHIVRVASHPQPLSTTFLWGAQLETGSVATSYIKTVASTATRPADVISKTGVSGDIGQVEGFVAVEVDRRVDTVVKSIITVLNSSNNNRISLSAEANNSIRAFIADGGTPQAIATATNQPAGKYKMLIFFDAGVWKFYVNGALIGTNEVAGWVNGMDKINLGVAFNNTLPLNDHLSQALIGKTAISDAEAISWTTL